MPIHDDRKKRLLAVQTKITRQFRRVHTLESYRRPDRAAIAQAKAVLARMEALEADLLAQGRILVDAGRAG